MRHLFLKEFILTLFGMFVFSHVSLAGSPLKIAATSTLFADLTRQICGEKAEVTVIASAKTNAHFYKPTPKDIRTVRNADLYIHWGLDLEAWSDPLLEAAGKSKLFRGGDGNIDLSQNIPLLEVPKEAVSRSQGDIHLYGNPHYHMNPENFKMMANTLAVKLKTVDAENVFHYDRNLKAFLQQLDQKTSEWKEMCKHCAGKEIISYHKDTDYLADFLNVKVEQFVEPKPGIPPMPQHLSFLQQYIKKNKIKVITISTYYPKSAAEKLAQKTGAELITIAHNAGEVKGTETIFEFFEFNIRQIAEAFKS